MKKDMTELKKLVLESFQSGGLTQNILKKHQNLFEDMESSIPFEEEQNNSSSLPLILDSHNNDRNKEDDEDEYEDNYSIEDIMHEEDDTSLSIEKKEKELILKAWKTIKIKENMRLWIWAFRKEPFTAK